MTTPGHQMTDPQTVNIEGPWWRAAAACRTQDPELMFVRGKAQNKQKEICSACPVTQECLTEAIENNYEWGIWGGMTERERRAWRRKRRAHAGHS